MAPAPGPANAGTVAHVRAAAATGASTLILLFLSGSAVAGSNIAPAAQISGAVVATAPGPHEYSCPIFPASNPLNREITHAPVDPRSAAYIAAIGAGGHLHPDFGTEPGYGIPYVVVGPSQPKVPIDFTEYGEESEPGPYPVSADAPVEGAGEEGDRHVIVLQTGTCRLYELYGASRHGAGWQAHLEDLGRTLAGEQSVWKARWTELTPAYATMPLA